MSITENIKSIKTVDQPTSEPCLEIIYQRLNENAPKLDIDPARGCIDFILNSPEHMSEFAECTPLSSAYLWMPMTTLGIVVPIIARARSAFFVANPIICPGFVGKLDNLRFHVIRNGFTIEKGQSICSLYLIPYSQSSFKIREIAANDTPPDCTIKEVISMELICSDGSFKTSRGQVIAAAQQAEKDREIAARQFELKTEIHQKIKITPIPGSQIPSELIERFLDSIIEHDHFDRSLNPRFNYTYEIVQFSTDIALEERLAEAKDNAHYSHYDKEKLNYENLYYGFLIERSAKHPFD